MRVRDLRIEVLAQHRPLNLREAELLHAALGIAIHELQRKLEAYSLRTQRILAAWPVEREVLE